MMNDDNTNKDTTTTTTIANTTNTFPPPSSSSSSTNDNPSKHSSKRSSSSSSSSKMMMNNTAILYPFEKIMNKKVSSKQNNKKKNNANYKNYWLDDDDENDDDENALLSLPWHDTKKEEEEEEEDGMMKVSYNTLILAASIVGTSLYSLILHLLQQRRKEHDDDDDECTKEKDDDVNDYKDEDECSIKTNTRTTKTKTTSQIKIAVSIPEGPLLPLSILVTHVLHFVPLVNAILIPIEPSEGIVRLKHILNDSNPRLILVAGGHDADDDDDDEENGKCCNNNDDDDDDVKRMKGLMKENKERRIVNVKKLVKEGYKKCRGLERRRKDELLVPIWKTNDDDDDDENNKKKEEMIDIVAMILRNIYLLSSSSQQTTTTTTTTTQQDVNTLTSPSSPPTPTPKNQISHIVYTSGTTGIPKGCISSLSSLLHYIRAKNDAHGISSTSRVLLASSLSFDPCLSDVLSAFYTVATLVVCERSRLMEDCLLGGVVKKARVSHVLCTPSLWSLTLLLENGEVRRMKKTLKVVALGGEPVPKRIISKWARRRVRTTKTIKPQNNQSFCESDEKEEEETTTTKLFATYGVTEACVYQTFGEIYYNDNNYDDDELNISKKYIQKGQNVGKSMGKNCFFICRHHEEDTTNNNKLATNNRNNNNTSDNGNGNGKTDQKKQQQQQQQNVIFQKENNGTIGEIILWGAQVDEYSCYLNRAKLNHDKFLVLLYPPLVATQKSEITAAAAANTTTTTTTTLSSSSSAPTQKYYHYYKTGDLGYIHPQTQNLHVVGRIQGEDGMVKINGVRVELGEIEMAIVDDDDDDDDEKEEGNSSSSLSSSCPLLVMDCLASIVTTTAKLNNDEGNDYDEQQQHQQQQQEEEEEEERKMIVAYCVLSQQCRRELNLPTTNNNTTTNNNAFICPPTGCRPLATVLRSRCIDKVKKGCTPSLFIIMDRVPLSPTGKKDRSGLPALKDCVSLPSSLSSSSSSQGVTTTTTTNGKESSSSSSSVLLSNYGKAGKAVSTQIIKCLNLQPRQQLMVTTNANFGALGGDSLAATRVVRALFAYNEGVWDSRFLGGDFGVLDGPFDAGYLLRVESLGEYVDFLDGSGVCCGGDKGACGVGVGGVGVGVGDGEVMQERKKKAKKGDDDNQENEAEDSNRPAKPRGKDEILYDALVEASTLGQSTIAISLLNLGANPNLGREKGGQQGGGKEENNGQRLGKITDRNQRRQQFKASPLHLACIRGDCILVQKLLEKGCLFNTPDATGSFPIHLACSGGGKGRGGGSDVSIKKECISASTVTGITDEEKKPTKEDLRRQECARMLLDAGTPLSIKDGNKQTVLHCAARSGHCHLLRYLMTRWKDAGSSNEIKVYRDKHRGGQFDWHDRWFRTPVHWAILNGNAEALRVLLECGCSACPPKPKGRGSSRKTSIVVETPSEMNMRLYGNSDGIGLEIHLMLHDATNEG